MAKSDAAIACPWACPKQLGVNYIIVNKKKKKIHLVEEKKEEHTTLNDDNSNSASISKLTLNP